MVRSVAGNIAVVLVVLLVIVGVGIYVAASDPLDDMRVRADALHLPSDFVLVRERYTGSPLGLFGETPKLERIYHAPWPGLCETLRSIRDRAGEPFELVQARGYEGRICSFGAWYPAGWRGWLKNFRHYQLRLYAWQPGLLEETRPQLPGRGNEFGASSGWEVIETPASD